MLKNIYRPRIVYHPAIELLPKGFTFPRAYLEYVNRKEIPQIYPWFFLCHVDHADYYEADTNYYEIWVEILKEQYPHRQLVPFAKWELTDDVACFEPSNDPNLPTIHYIHVCTKPGYEERGSCDTFEEWLMEVTSDAEQYQAEFPDYADDFDDYDD